MTRYSAPLPVAAAAAPVGPVLRTQDFAQAFPFYLHVDASLRVIGAGAALFKACPALCVGGSLNELFECEPAQLVALPARAKLRLVARQRLPLQLVGGVLPQSDGSLLLLLSGEFQSAQEMGALGLGLEDLPPHDLSAELMLVRRSASLNLEAVQAESGQWRQRAEYLSSMLELAAGGVLYFDAQGLLRHCNLALERILEMPADELQGLPLAQMDAVLQSAIVGIEPVPLVLQSLADELLRQRRTVPALLGDSSALITEELPTLTVQLALPARKVIRIGARCVAGGALIYYFNDITREAEVDRMKSDFLATAAHELRTPMVSVLGFTELLLAREFPPDKQRDMIDTVHRQAGVLVGLVNELLDLSRIEARRGQDFVMRPCALMPVVQQAAATLMIVDERRKVQLGFERDASGQASRHLAEALVLVDPEKLCLALSNVLSNAFKYSPGGGDVQVWLRSADLEGRAAVAIDVVDQGIGMSREQLAHLFERFWRADPCGAIPGTGLGMSLVQEIIELLGGRVDVDSLPGRGTRVSMTLPLMVQEAHETEDRQERPLFSPG